MEVDRQGNVHFLFHTNNPTPAVHNVYTSILSNPSITHAFFPPIFFSLLFFFVVSMVILDIFAVGSPMTRRKRVEGFQNLPPSLFLFLYTRKSYLFIVFCGGGDWHFIELPEVFSLRVILLNMIIVVVEKDIIFKINHSLTPGKTSPLT